MEYEAWSQWITDIGADEAMSVDRVLRHIQKHASKDMPNADAPDWRWMEWIAGMYNLLAILQSMKSLIVPFSVGVRALNSQLHTRLKNPRDYTPPPERLLGIISELVSKGEKTIRLLKKETDQCLVL